MTSLLRSASQLRTLLGLAVILGVVSAQAGAGTLALFTDTAASASNTFVTGNVDLRLIGASAAADTTGLCATADTSYADSLASALFSYNLNNATAIAADVATPLTQAICLKNKGSLDLKWGLATTALSNTTVDTRANAGNTPLAEGLKIRIFKLTNSTDTCTDGLTASGAYATVSGAADLLSTTGSVKTVATGDTNVSTVGISSSQVTIADSATPTLTKSTGATPIQKLCVTVVLPAAYLNNSGSDDYNTAGTTIQGQTLTGTFTFTGTAI